MIYKAGSWPELRELLAAPKRERIMERALHRLTRARTFAQAKEKTSDLIGLDLEGTE